MLSQTLNHIRYDFLISFIAEELEGQVIVAYYGILLTIVVWTSEMDVWEWRSARQFIASFQQMSSLLW